MGVRKGVWAAGDCATAEPDACEKEEDLSLSVGTDGLVLSLIFGVVVFGLEALFSAVAAAARADAEVLILSLTIAVDVGGGDAGWLAGRRDVVVVSSATAVVGRLQLPGPVANPSPPPVYLRSSGENHDFWGPKNHSSHTLGRPEDLLSGRKTKRPHSFGRCTKRGIYRHGTGSGLCNPLP